jgi:hypothetical protein
MHSTVPLKLTYVHVNIVGTIKLYASYVKVKISNFVGTTKKAFDASYVTFSETDIIKMLELFIVNIFFNRQSVFLWVPTCSFISLSIGTSYSGISRITKRSQPYPVISRFDIDNVPSLNNSTFGDFVNLIYPIELEIKVTTNTARSNS